MKKQYTKPKLIVHGSIEDITNFHKGGHKGHTVDVIAGSLYNLPDIEIERP